MRAVKASERSCAELDEHLGKLALATGRSESFIIREALAEYVAKAAREADREGNPPADCIWRGSGRGAVSAFPQHAGCCQGYDCTR